MCMDSTLTHSSPTLVVLKAILCAVFRTRGKRHTRCWRCCVKCHAYSTVDLHLDVVGHQIYILFFLLMEGSYRRLYSVICVWLDWLILVLNWKEWNSMWSSVVAHTPHGSMFYACWDAFLLNTDTKSYDILALWPFPSAILETLKPACLALTFLHPSVLGPL